MTDRYVARWHNGYWRVFDTHEYAPVDVTRDMGAPWLKLQSVCEDMTRWFNENWA